MCEEWRDIPEYEGWYQVSNLGNVKRVRVARNTKPGRILKPIYQRNGYVTVWLSKNNIRKIYSIHVLVCTAFYGPCPAKHCVNHKDGIRDNNHADNLEWVTYSENQLHSVNTLNRYNSVGEKHGMSRLKEKDIIEIRKLYATGRYRQHEIASLFDIDQSTVSDIITRKRWKHVS